MIRVLTIAVLLGILGPGSGRSFSQDVAPEPVVLPMSDDSNDKASGDGLFVPRIAPIFKRYCLSCHGPDRQEGGLRLDRYESVTKGGHTGTSLLTTNLDENGILQRVTTNDVSVRMPKDAPPLSVEEMDSLRTWIEQGAGWTDLAFEAPREDAMTALPRYALSWERWPGWNPFQWTDPQLHEAEQWIRWFTGPLLGLILIIGLCERSRMWVRDERRWTRGRGGFLFRQLARVPKLAYAVAVTLLLLAFGVTYYQVQTTSADGQIESLLAQIQQLETRLNPPLPSESPEPRPVHPKHPPRLGGEYYRGNDERSEKLFNGGFYRTATMRLSLRDANGKPLARGDVLESSEGAVHLEVEQAPLSAPSLFSDTIWSKTYVSDVGRGKILRDRSRQIASFSQIDDQTWDMSFPIRLPTSEDQPTSGTLYVYRGDIPSQMVEGEPHYAAEYHLSLKDGRLSEESELWMGYVFRTGNVTPLPAGKIAEDEWFSFRPIPIITGDRHTADPELLGIDEYLPPPQDAITPATEEERDEDRKARKSP